MGEWFVCCVHQSGAEFPSYLAQGGVQEGRVAHASNTRDSSDSFSMFPWILRLQSVLLRDFLLFYCCFTSHYGLYVHWLPRIHMLKTLCRMSGIRMWDLGEVLRSWAITKVTNALIKEATQSFLAFSTVWGYSEKGLAMKQKETPHYKATMLSLDLGFLVSRTVIIECLLFII